MPEPSPRAKLIQALARLEAHRRDLEQARGKVRARAAEQRDVHDPVEQAWGEHVEAGTGGGWYARRRLLTLQQEGHALDRIEAATRGRTGG